MNRMRIRLKPSLVRAVFNRNGLWTSDDLMKVRRVSALEIGKLYEGRGNDANHNEFHVVLKPGEKILLAARCQCITPFSTREGDILLSDSKAYFFDMSQPSSTLSTSSPETHRRRRKEKRKRQLQQQQKKLSLEKQDGEESEKRGEAEEERQQARGSWKKGVVRDQDEELLSTKETKQKKCKRTAGNTNKSIVWLYEDIKEIHKRRYLLKNTALEIFLTTGRTHLLAFAETAERDNIYDKLLSMDLPNRVDYESEVSGNLLRSSITDKWKRGLISNFEYLMHLNTLAGRSFNDLTQYPIFPFLLKDYTSDELDLTNPETFRDLSKPMGAQDPARLQKFVEKYQMVLEMGEKPYYYGSHYSNIGSVLYYLVRMNPFSKAFVEFQGGNFDVPDRSFHSLESTWLLSSRLSSSDVKELIPEFFYLPDFLLNSNDFDMGVKQNGWRVDDVMLPPWAKGSPRLFIQKHREALECRYVSERLHQWIDLMFGHLQSGEGARRAHNLFHPLTYEGAVDVDLIDDPVRKRATIAQISSYGQTPRQLFKRPHAERSSSFLLVPSSSLTLYPSSSSPSSSFASSEDSFIYLKSWTQSVVHVYPHPIASLAFVGSGGDQPLALPPDRLLFPNATRFVSWNHWDQNLRICSLEQKKVLLVLKTMHDEDVLCAAMTAPAGQYLVTGGTSSIIKVWKLKRDKNMERIGGKGATMRISLFSFLSGHYDHVLSVAVSKDWNIIVSGSADGTAIIWDLNRARYFKSLRLEQALQSLHSHQQRSSASQHRCYHSINGDSLDSQINCAFLLDRLSALRSFDHELRSSSPQLCVTSVAISKTTGNIFTVHNIGEQRPNNAAHTFSQNKNLKRESRPSTWSRRRQQKEDEETSILYSSSVDRSKEAENGPSFLSMWSINGRLLAATLCESRINCLALTTGVEGLCKNIVIGGLQNGGLRVWDSFDLTLLHDIKPHEVNSSSPSSSSSPTSSSPSLNDVSDTTNVSSSSSPGSLPTVTVQTSAFPAITALCLNDENTQLLTGDESGTVLSWAVKRTTNPTQFIRNLTTRQRRPSTAIPVSSSASSPIKTNSGNYSNAKDQLQQQQAQTETAPPEETPSNGEEEEQGN
ncbi:WD repeat and FYVE domain-containing protein 3 [Balamuthia mandrillaris]